MLSSLLNSPLSGGKDLQGSFLLRGVVPFVLGMRYGHTLVHIYGPFLSRKLYQIRLENKGKERRDCSAKFLGLSLMAKWWLSGLATIVLFPKLDAANTVFPQELALDSLCDFQVRLCSNSWGVSIRFKQCRRPIFGGEVDNYTDQKEETNKKCRRSISRTKLSVVIM